MSEGKISLSFEQISMIDELDQWYENRIDELERQLAESKEDRARLIAAANAYREMNVCYRVGKRPSERLFDQIKKAGELLEAIDAARKAAK